MRSLGLTPLVPYRKSEVVSVKSGSLFILGWRSNEQYKHFIAREVDWIGPRISLTFRWIKTKAPANEFGVR